MEERKHLGKLSFEVYDTESDVNIEGEIPAESLADILMWVMENIHYIAANNSDNYTEETAASGILYMINLALGSADAVIGRKVLPEEKAATLASAIAKIEHMGVQIHNAGEDDGSEEEVEAGSR